MLDAQDHRPRAIFCTLVLTLRNIFLVCWQVAAGNSWRTGDENNQQPTEREPASEKIMEYIQGPKTWHFNIYIETGKQREY